MKKEKNNSYKLIESLYTVKQARKTKAKLEKLVDNLYQAGDNRETISEIFTTNEKQLLLEDLKNRNIDPNKSEARDVIMEIIKKINQMTKTTIEVAFSPSDTFIKEITDQINSIYGRPTLIESKYNPAIGGGIIIYRQGRRFDYSINKKLDEINI